jgi:hypothetical protein
MSIRHGCRPGIGNIETRELLLEVFVMIERKPLTVVGIGSHPFSTLLTYGKMIFMTLDRFFSWNCPISITSLESYRNRRILLG